MSKHFTPYESRLRAWASSAGYPRFMTASTERCLGELRKRGKLEEFYTAFPMYRPGPGQQLKPQWGPHS